jgi:LEA14-like dessication related protein
MVLAMSSCKVYEEVKVSDVQNVIIGDVTSDGVEAQIYFEIENPNWYKMTLKESNIEVYVEGKYFGTIDQFDEIIIPKQSKTTQVLRVKASSKAFNDLLGNALKLLFKNELKLEAKGYVVGKALLVRQRIDVSVVETISKGDLGL